MQVISFSMKELAQKDALFKVQFNSGFIFLLPKELTELTNTVEKLTDGITGECRVRFAYEILCQDYTMTLCKDKENVEVHSLSQTLAKINHTDNNLPTEKAFLIVPDELNSQFTGELCKQLCLLQVPFEIQKESYQKFTANSEQIQKDLNELKKLCSDFNISDKEINSLIKTDLTDTAKSVETLLNHKEPTPTLIALGDFPFKFDSADFGLPVKLVQKLSTEVISKDAGCIFVLKDANNDFSQFNNYKKLDRKNILFLLKRNTSNPNISLLLARTAEELKKNGFGDSCLTFVDENNIDLVINIIRSFCTYLKQKPWNLTELIDEFNDTFSQLENNCSKFFDEGSYNVEKKKLSANKLHTEIKRMINNEALLFHDILPKVLLYDSQQKIEDFFTDFQNMYCEILDKVAASVHFSEEQTLRAIYKGHLPPEIIQFLKENDNYLSEMYESTIRFLDGDLHQIFIKRMDDFKRLSPEDWKEEFEVLPSFESLSPFNPPSTYSLDWLKKTLSAEQLKILVRHNSQVLSFKNFRKVNEKLDDNDIIFLVINFRKELRRFLEFEFNKKAASLKLTVTWEISSDIEKFWLDISDNLHARIESMRKDFSSSLKEIDDDNKCLQTETNKYVKFLRKAQRATESLRMLV